MEQDQTQGAQSALGAATGDLAASTDSWGW